MSALPPVCVLAGGLGTRLGEAARDTPKALLEVAGRPFALWQLELLRDHGARRVVMCVGHLGERIEAEVGAPFGLDVRYVHDPPGRAGRGEAGATPELAGTAGAGATPELAGTAGAVRGALELLGERFLVLYGDTYLRIDYAAVARAHAASGLPALMTVLRNEGRWDTSNTLFDGERVLRYDKRAPTPDMAWIDYGLGAFSPAAFASVPPVSDLAEVYATLAARGELAGYAATERFYEIGTPESLAEASAFLGSLASSGSRRA